MTCNGLTQPPCWRWGRCPRSFSFPVAWVLAQRPLPVSQRLQRLTARLTESGAARLHLRPLHPAAAEAMAADLLGARLDSSVAELVARAAGSAVGR